jgi:hypothetical protein
LSRWGYIHRLFFRDHALQWWEVWATKPHPKYEEIMVSDAGELIDSKTLTANERRSLTMRNVGANPEYRQRLSEKRKALLADPEQAALHAERNRATANRPEQRQLRSANAKAQWSDAAAREARSASYKAKWADPDYRAAILAKRRATLEAKKKAPAVAGAEHSQASSA